ncbi:uncharacterized protein [Enoplosus armatus]|uniref:uncharacterized protein n=1 Tax=Enoplosus armatus TaxID=215367 RepID=UPI003995128F
MWGVALILFSCVAVQVASHEIKVECREFYDFPPTGSFPPSVLADLKVSLVRGTTMLNVSWAIHMDASIGHLTGTRFVGEAVYHCEYDPPLVKTDHGPKQKWFHYLVEGSYGFNNIQVANLPLPLPGGESAYKITNITIPRPKQSTVEPRTPPAPKVEITTTTLGLVSTGDVYFIRIAVGIFGGVASMLILSSCYIIYKRCGSTFSTSLGFKRLPTSPLAPVPVLVVYPAENSAFQRAVVALAEFLQWHGGCSVALDMWQQGKIAGLGPMRWLAEKANAADRVLIVCPQAEIPSSQPSHSPPNHNSPEPSIPAAAHDLYPLILNMVASHAKTASDLAKFWVVQLGKQQDKRPNNLALELGACKTFCLMKDLNRLCRSLHTQRQDGKKTSDQIFRPGIAHSEKSTVKLREAVEKLGGDQPSIFRQMEPLKSVVTTI